MELIMILFAFLVCMLIGTILNILLKMTQKSKLANHNLNKCMCINICSNLKRYVMWKSVLMAFILRGFDCT